MRRRFNIGEFYHLFNKGVDKRKIYLEKGDYGRFIYDLYEFNDTRPAEGIHRSYKKAGNDQLGKNVGNEVSCLERISSIKNGRDKKKLRDVLINLHAFVLMPNHHHLMASQIQQKGLPLFIRKLHGGYSRYFNNKYRRKGHLFEGPFQHKHIENDIHFGFLICYIHAKPLDLWKSNWKEKQLTDQEIKQALKFLEKYKWSSHRDYIGMKTYPLLINRQFLLDFFDGVKGYKEFFIDWLRQYKKNIEHLSKYLF